MAHQFAALAFTPIVRRLQEQAGSRASYSAMDAGDDYNNLLTEREASFISERDSFYMASVSETGWPYIQHRGGPIGFMKPLDATRIGFADYAGNRQYVSTGNFINDERVALFFMDYASRRRLKLLGRVELIGPEDKETLPSLTDPDYLATIEKGMVIHVQAFDWNCPQHITPRFSEDQVRELLLPSLRQEIASEVDTVSTAAVARTANPANTEGSIGDGPLELMISGMHQLTLRIRSFELRSPDGSDLPAVAAGDRKSVV